MSLTKICAILLTTERPKKPKAMEMTYSMTLSER